MTDAPWFGNRFVDIEEQLGRGSGVTEKFKVSLSAGIVALRTHGACGSVINAEAFPKHSYPAS